MMSEPQGESVVRVNLNRPPVLFKIVNMDTGVPSPIASAIFLTQEGHRAKPYIMKQWNRAECRRPDNIFGVIHIRSHDDRAPFVDCTCGFYLYTSVDQLRHDLRSHMNGWHTIMSAEVGGKMIVHEAGVRVEYMRPLKLWWPKEVTVTPQQDNGVRWASYLVDQEIRRMASEGLITMGQATEAMHHQQGEVFLRAAQNVLDNEYSEALRQSQLHRLTVQSMIDDAIKACQGMERVWSTFEKSLGIEKPDPDNHCTDAWRMLVSGMGGIPSISIGASSPTTITAKIIPASAPIYMGGGGILSGTAVKKQKKGK